jgi:hypothetical protein
MLAGPVVGLAGVVITTPIEMHASQMLACIFVETELESGLETELENYLVMSLAG